MSDKIREIATLLEQMTVAGERNATIYVTCIRELRAVAVKMDEGGDENGYSNPEH